MRERIYDSVIIGAGPAGLAAALYNARDRFDTLVLEKFYPGGQIINTDRMENFPGFENISGADLIQRLQSQAEKFGAKIATSQEATALEKLPDGDIKVSCSKEEFISKAVILAPGSSYRNLGVSGEDVFRNAGAGVSYCGTCDAPFFKGKKVVAVGGGNTAVEETLHLAKFAGEVTLVHRRQEFRATKILVEELMDKVNEPNSNLRLQLDTVITDIEGENKVEKVVFKNVKTNQREDFSCDGIFIFIGTIPNTSFLRGFVELTVAGFIKCESAFLRTNMPGVFVAGDCRVAASMQLATAVGDGVTAAMAMKQYFRDPNWWNEPISDSLQPGGW